MAGFEAASIDFEALFDAAPGIYLVLDADFRMVAANEARLRVTMTTREAVIGRNLFDVFPDNPDDPAADGVRNLRTSLERVLQTKTADAMAVQKYDIQRPESQGGGFEVRYWSPLNTPVLGPAGEVRYIIHRVEDVTDFMRLKQQEARLQSHADRIEHEIYQRAQEVQNANRRFETANAELVRLYEKTKELDATKTRFFANISHELRTPLTLILGPVERMLKEEAIQGPQRQTLEMVARNGRLLLHHVNDLLDVAKLDAGKMEARYVETDLAALTRFIGGHFESLAQDRGIAFSIDAPASVLAETDVEKVQRVLLNLLSNAFKFTPEGGRIACVLRVNGTAASFSVEDSGPGVPEAQRAVIFEPFRQADEEATRRFGGTGLGLAIAKEFLELLGGEISVEDAPDGGARFAFSLPLIAPPDQTVGAASAGNTLDADLRYVLGAETSPSTPEASLIARGIGRPLALVIEDNPDMSAFIAEGLRLTCAVARAADGRLGLDKALELKPDIILTDMMMPNMSGDQVVEALRSRPEFDETPIILLTAKTDDETRVSLLRGGVQDVLTKPFNTDELLARVANLLDAKRAGDALRKRQHVSEQKRRDLMEQARDALFVLDGEGRVVEANRQARTMLRRDAQEIEGKVLSELIALPREMDGVADFEALLEQRTFEASALPLDVGQGRIVHVDLSATRVNAEGSEALLVIARDVSERVSLQEQLRQSQKLEAMGQLTGGVAHDFNNLLTVVTTSTERLAAALRDQPTLLPMLEQIDRAVDRGEQLTSRLLTFARKQTLRRIVIDLNAIVQRATEMLGRTLGEHVGLEVNLENALWPSVADAAQVEDALLNLCINARDAMPNGGRLSIETRNHRLTDADASALGADASSGDYATLIVRDTGTGMSRETLARAVEPFFTTKDVGSGTGLGLSMVYGFAKQSGGWLQIESEVGRGTSITLYLPRGAPSESEGAVPAVEGAPRGQGELILFVEDDADVRAATAGLLTDLGYRVIQSGDGRAALAALNAAPEAALLFTDVVLPNGMSGFELCEAARSARPELRVLLGSGYSKEAVQKNVEGHRDFVLLTKPYRKNALGCAIASALQQGRA
jgi:PAS domain S-box-containing protein